MSSDAEFRIRIEKIVAGGDGLGRHEGKVVFVPFTLPGEVVSVRAVSGKKDFLRAELLDVHEASPDRRQPPCPLFTRCGGCSLQHMSYARQLEVKQTYSSEGFYRVGGINISDLQIVGGSELYYRNRVQIHRRSDGLLGFMQRNSRSVIAVNHCYISLPPINELLENPPAGRRDRFPVFAFDQWCRSGEVPDEEAVGSVPVLGRNITFSVKGFFQSNLGALEKMLPEIIAAGKAISAESSGGTLVDLYAGVGLFGAFLQDYFSRVLTVEHNRYSLDLARQNVSASGAGFYPQDADIWAGGPDAEADPSLVVVDPPRSGLGPGVRAYLARINPAGLLYISCDPVTLARDAGFLRSNGYRMQSCRLYDFYPQTSHVEALAIFRKEKHPVE